MMEKDRLIELDAAVSALDGLPMDYGRWDVDDVLHALASVPTVDAVPVRHGRWREDTGGYGFWICSACGFVSEASAADMLYKFCPVCGAKMDGKDGDQNG